MYLRKIQIIKQSIWDSPTTRQQQVCQTTSLPELIGKTFASHHLFTCIVGSLPFYNSILALSGVTVIAQGQV